MPHTQPLPKEDLLVEIWNFDNYNYLAPPNYAPGLNVDSGLNFVVDVLSEEKKSEPQIFHAEFLGNLNIDSKY